EPAHPAEAREDLGGPRGRALQRAPHPHPAREGRASRRGRLAHQALLLGDREERHRRAHSRAPQGSARRSRGSGAMNFAFTDDQVLLKNSARALLDEHCKPEHVRAMQDDARGYGEALWGEMAKLGWLGLPFPEQYGGAGLGLVELALLHEEMGRAAYPGPFLATVVLGGV